MAKEIVWTRRVTQFFEDAANLSELERQILETRIAGMTRVQQSMYFNLSLRSIDRLISQIKDKYDIVQEEYPDQLRPRRPSEAEKYMDEH